MVIRVLQLKQMRYHNHTLKGVNGLNKKMITRSFLSVAVLSSILLVGCNSTEYTPSRTEDIKQNKVEVKKVEQVILTDDEKTKESLLHLAFAYGMVKDTLPEDFRKDASQLEVAHEDYLYRAESNYMLFQFNEVTLRSNVVKFLNENQNLFVGKEKDRVLELNDLLNKYVDTSNAYLNHVSERDEKSEPLGKDVFEKHAELVEAQQAFLKAVEQSVPAEYLVVELEKRMHQNAYLLQYHAEELMHAMKDEEKGESLERALKDMNVTVEVGLENAEKAESLGKLSEGGVTTEQGLRDIGKKVEALLAESEPKDQQVLELIESTKLFTTISDDILEPSVEIKY